MLSDCGCLDFGHKDNYDHSKNGRHGSEASLASNAVVTSVTTEVRPHDLNDQNVSTIMTNCDHSNNQIVVTVTTAL